MPSSTVTSKGQLTIPKPIRDALRLEAGDEVLFVRHHDARVEMVARNLGVDDLLARLRAIVPSWSGPPVTVEEMNDAIAEEVAALDRATLGTASDVNRERALAAGCDAVVTFDAALHGEPGSVAPA